jgi:hypothetical protein
MQISLQGENGKMAASSQDDKRAETRKVQPFYSKRLPWTWRLVKPRLGAIRLDPARGVVQRHYLI